MGMSFKIQKPDGTQKDVTVMSYVSFSDIIRVGEAAGVDLDEYDRIMDYSGLEDEWVIQLEDVRKILLFYQNLLDLVEELDRKGICLMTETEEQRRKRESAGMRTTPQDRWKKVMSSLRRLIDLCEKTIKVGGSIVIII